MSVGVYVSGVCRLLYPVSRRVLHVVEEELVYAQFLLSCIGDDTVVLV